MFGFRVFGLGYSVWGGLGERVCLGFRVLEGLGFGVWGLRFRGWGVWGFGGVWDLGFWV